MRIAMIGQRGVPATFGGIEHHVHQLGRRFAEAGHEVIVYCRPNYVSAELSFHEGMRLRHVPTIPSKHLDAIVHSALSSVDSLFRHADIVHFHAVGPGLVSPIPRYLGRARIVQTIHGLDADRGKWSRVGSAVLNVGTWFSARVPDATVVVSRFLQDHYRERFDRDTTYLPNGITVPDGHDHEYLAAHGLEAGAYVLFVGRIVPEKGVDQLVRAFHSVDTDARLAVAGGSSYSDAFTATVEREAAADDRVELLGYVYGEQLGTLYRHAAAFVNPSLLEGLPLTLLEAVGAGRPVVVTDIPAHREIVGDESGPGHRISRAGDEADLARALGQVLEDPGAEERAAAPAAERIRAHYDWDRVADETLALYDSLLT